MSEKLDIFDVLNNMDKRNYSFYDNLTVEQKKAFVPLVIMRWMSNAPDNNNQHAYFLMMTNELVNKNFWDKYKHPELVAKLMAMLGTGKVVKHQWIKGTNKKAKTPLEQFIDTVYPNLNDTDTKLLFRQLTLENLEELMRSYAIDDKDRVKLRKQYKECL